MKILIVQDYLRSGGTERQSVFLANAFSAGGHEVQLLTFRPGGPLASTVSRDVSRHALQPFDTHCDWFAPGLKSYLLQHPVDIVLCMGRMANCYGATIVNTIRRHHRRTSVIGTMRTGKRLPRKFQSSLKQAHHIVANSHAAKEHLQSYYALEPSKISVIANSLVFNKTPDETVRQQLRAQHGASNHTTVLLDVAMFRPEKNQRELIEIASRLPADFDWQLWLVGDGPALRSCRRLAERLSLTDRVKFFGLQRVPAPCYAAADIAVHASRSESLSNFLIEAQSHGLPAVAYAAQGVGECFLPGETGEVIPHGDQDAFRAAILRYTSPDLTRQERARTFARNAFDPQRQARAYLDLFERLLTSHS